MNETGWQADGTYVPCPECRWEPPQRRGGPGIEIRMPVTTHYADCSTVQFLTREQNADLQAALEETARCRRRAMADAHNYVIG